MTAVLPATRFTRLEAAELLKVEPFAIDNLIRSGGLFEIDGAIPVGSIERLCQRHGMWPAELGTRPIQITVQWIDCPRGDVDWDTYNLPFEDVQVGDLLLSGHIRLIVKRQADGRLVSATIEDHRSVEIDDCEDELSKPVVSALIQALRDEIDEACC